MIGRKRFDLVKKLAKKTYKTINPIDYWRNMGLVFGENVEIAPASNFDTEPHMISIGNNVKITSGVRFVTHDDWVYVLRNLMNNPNIDLVKRTYVGNKVFIGNNATIMPG